MKTKNKILVLLLSLGLLLASSCGDSTLIFTASNTSRSVVLDSNVIITDFQISIREVELKPETNPHESSKKVTYEGPYVLDLIGSSDPLEQVLDDSAIEPDTYRLIRFNLHKNKSVTSEHPLYMRSIYIAGTINGTNFTMWHDADENFDITNSGGITIDGSESIVVRFHLHSFLNAEVSLNLSTADATDNIIEINPYSSSSINRDLARDLKRNIKASADFFKD